MQKILFFFDEDVGNTRGGSELILRQIFDYYAIKGNEIHVLFKRDKKYSGWEKITSEKVYLYYGGNFMRFASNIAKLKRIHFDYAFSTFTNFTGLLGVLKQIGFLKINTLVGRESTVIFDRYQGRKLFVKKLIYHLGYHSVDTLICQTQYMKDCLIQNLPWLIKTTKVVVAPNPVDMSLINRMTKDTIDTSAFKPYIVTAGRFIKEKGYDVLLDSFLIVHQCYPFYKLVFLGDGPLMEIIREKTKKLNLNEYVLFKGYVDNVFPYFKNAELCVISSNKEGFPNVLLQMMSQNNNVVSTLCAGGVDKIKGVMTCKVGDSEALAQTIIECINKDNTSNRVLFDRELESRSIQNFMSIVLQPSNN